MSPGSALHRAGRVGPVRIVPGGSVKSEPGAAVGLLKNLTVVKCILFLTVSLSLENTKVELQDFN